MIGKVQCDVISFEEFHEQHQDETIIIPSTSGFDGTFLYQLALTAVFDILAALIVYIIQKKIDGAGPDGTVTIDFEDGFKIEIPLAKFDNSEKVMKRIKEAHEAYLKMKEV